MFNTHHTTIQSNNTVTHYHNTALILNKFYYTTFKQKAKLSICQNTNVGLCRVYVNCTSNFCFCIYQQKMKKLDSSTTRELAVLYNIHWVSLGSSKYQFLTELVQAGKESKRKYEMVFTNKTPFCKLAILIPAAINCTTVHYTTPDLE